MEPQTRKSFCNTIEYVLDFTPKEFARTALKATKLEKALSVYDK